MAIIIRKEDCTGCGKCVKECPTECLEVENKVVVLRTPDLCLDCGYCQTFCFFDAIDLPTV